MITTYPTPVPVRKPDTRPRKRRSIRPIISRADAHKSDKHTTTPPSKPDRCISAPLPSPPPSPETRPYFPRTTSDDDLHLVKRFDENVLTNWSGIKVLARKSQILHPTDEEELGAIVRDAKQVRVVGSALSYEELVAVPMFSDDSVVVSLDKFRTGMLRLTTSTATFGAATSVNDVIAILGNLGRMLPCNPGVIGIQTIAGSIATGTHGQGLRQAAYADAVVSLRVVLPSGEAVTVFRDGGDLPLDAFTVSMGLLGVVTEMELETQPRRVFSMTKVTTDYNDFLENYISWNEEAEFVKVWWFPDTDKVHSWFTNEASTPDSLSFLSTSTSEPLETSTASTALNDTVQLYTSHMAEQTKTSSTTKPDADQFRTIARFANAKNLTGWVEQLLTKGIPVPQINCEIAIPVRQFKGAVEALRSWCVGNRGRLHYPFIFRTTGKSRAWLYAGYKEPVVWIGFLVYLAQDGTVMADSFEMMKDLQVLLGRFGGLPHWGKHLVKDCFDFEGGLPKLEEFRELRRKVDPTRKFGNDFVDTLLQ